MSNPLYIEVENGDQVRRDLHIKERDVTKAINEAVKEWAHDLYGKIVDTSPIDTGEYQSRWEIDGSNRFGGWLITNDTPYAKYLVWPNEFYRGYIGADDPSRGIHHNVRGLIFERRRELREKIQKAVNSELR